MDWFERITGFAEQDYPTTRSRLAIVDGRLRSSASPNAFSVGTLETPSLGELRARARDLDDIGTPTTVRCVQGDVRGLHGLAEGAGALFQAASQFNLLEMVSPDVTPEDGVARYAFDATQGPACAIAAGADTIYRNYFAVVDGQAGQRWNRQIDCLRDVLAGIEETPGELGQMRNGYWMTTPRGIDEVDTRLQRSGPEEIDALRARLRIGLHWRVDVTDGAVPQPVSQAYCSALPIAYNRAARTRRWERFASLVLQAAYEATLLAARLNRRDHGVATVFLTRLGGGVFGNDPAWITEAMRQALAGSCRAGLDVRIVSPSAPAPEMLALARSFTPT